MAKYQTELGFNVAASFEAEARDGQVHLRISIHENPTVFSLGSILPKECHRIVNVLSGALVEAKEQKDSQKEGGAPWDA